MKEFQHQSEIFDVLEGKDEGNRQIQLIMVLERPSSLGISSPPWCEVFARVDPIEQNS